MQTEIKKFNLTLLEMSFAVKNTKEIKEDLQALKTSGEYIYSMYEISRN